MEKPAPPVTLLPCLRNSVTLGSERRYSSFGISNQRFSTVKVYDFSSKILSAELYHCLCISQDFLSVYIFGMKSIGRAYLAN